MRMVFEHLRLFSKLCYITIIIVYVIGLHQLQYHLGFLQQLLYAFVPYYAVFIIKAITYKPESSFTKTVLTISQPLVISFRNFLDAFQVWRSGWTGRRQRKGTSDSHFPKRSESYVIRMRSKESEDDVPAMSSGQKLVWERSKPLTSYSMRLT